MYDDDPDWRCMINFLSSMYSQHPVKNDIAGSVESISKIDKELLYKCYRNFYNMANMALFVIGDITPETVDKCVEETICNYEILEDLPKRDYGNEPISVVRREVKQSMDVSVPSFMFGYKDTDTGYDGIELLKKGIELSVINEVAFGKSSYIYNKLYNDGLIMGFLDYECECEKDYGFTALSAESNAPEEAKKVILKGVEKLKKDGVKADDFIRLKRAFIGKFIKQFDNINSVAHGFLANLFNNIQIFDYIKAINEVTLDDINKRLQNCYNEEFSVLSVIEPAKK